MSKHDFPEAEFRDRQARTRRAIAEAGLDWLLVISPVSLHWLIGSDTKGYTSFQCLPCPPQPRPLVMFARETDRNELEADTLADELRGWNGREPEDPMDAFARLVDELGSAQGAGGNGGAVLVSASASLSAHQVHARRRAGGGADDAGPRSQAGEIAARAGLYPQICAHRRRRAGCAAGARGGRPDGTGTGRGGLPHAAVLRQRPARPAR